MPRKGKKRDVTSMYCRSYVVTLGIAFAAMSVFVWRHDDAETGQWPWWAFVLLTASLLGGITLVLFGLLGPSSKMERWAEVLSRDEASVIIMVLAYPVHLLISPFYCRR